MTLSRRAILAAPLAIAPTGSARAGDFEARLETAMGGKVGAAWALRAARRAIALAQGRADRLLRASGLSAGSVARRLRELSGREDYLYPDSDAGRDQAVSEMNATLERLASRLRPVLGGLPALPARVQRMSAADEAAGRGGYRIAPKGNEAGSYVVDLKAIRNRPSWTLPSVAFHEVDPGHLFQMTVPASGGQGVGPVQSPPALFEAWAIYAELLCSDLGAYRHDPLGEIGFLQWRLFRMGRIVADIGLNLLGWSQDEAVATLTEIQGQSIAFITIEADVARIATSPARYAAEGLGALRLEQQRPGVPYLWPRYHRAVLQGAGAPFGRLGAPSA